MAHHLSQSPEPWPNRRLARFPIGGQGRNTETPGESDADAVGERETLGLGGPSQPDPIPWAAALGVSL